MPTARPNFLLLVGEDTGCHHGCYGNAYAHTPHLDRLASQGTLYTKATATCSVCAPSRCSIVTSTYPWAIGTHHMRSTLVSPPRMVTHELRDVGYFVNWANKTDFNFEPPEDFADAKTDWVEDLAAGRLPDRPWFYYMNFGVTHESIMWSEPFQGGGSHHSLARHREQCPNAAIHDPAKAPVPSYLPDTPEVRNNIAWYFDALALQDAQIGRALAALEASGQSDRTIVIYLADHGRGLAREKRWCYGAGVYVPLIVRVPEALRGMVGAPYGTGVRCDDVVSWVDIAPTILSLAGVPCPTRYQGSAFLGPARGAVREYAVAARDRMDEAFDRCRAVRDKRWHYIRNDFPKLPYAQRVRYMEHMDTTRVIRRLNAEGKLTGAARLWMSLTKPPEELYDAVADPDMVNNLAVNPAHEATRARMSKALDEHLARFGDLGLVPERELVSRGVVKDRLKEYAQRISPLPPELQIGPERTLLEMHEAVAYCERV